MNKIEDVFRNTGDDKILIPYITAGDPRLDFTEKVLMTLDDSGADIIEVGIPFSDPLADGPVIQDAGQRALQQGTTLTDIIELCGQLQERVSSPLVLMGYYNSILRYGKKRFIEDIKRAGIAGVIIPDLPYNEDMEFYQELKQNNLAGILLAAPNTPSARLQEIAESCSGFLYCVSLLGVTGSEQKFMHLENYIKRVREHTDLPLALGFGIDGPAKAKQVSQYVDGIIIGSAIIKIINNNRDNPQMGLREVRKFIGEIKAVI